MKVAGKIISATYDRATNQVMVGETLSGTMGAISMIRLCELLETAGETRPEERITGLMIRDNQVVFCVTGRGAP